MQVTRILLQLLAIAIGATTALAGDWQTDYEQALSTAKTANKRVLLNFTGTDWCSPCIAMHRNVFAKPAFKEFARKNLILVEVDFPRRKKLPPAVAQQNDRLAHQYKIEVTPTLILLNPDGKFLGQYEGYEDEGPAKIIGWIEQASGKPK